MAGRGVVCRRDAAEFALGGRLLGGGTASPQRIDTARKRTAGTVPLLATTDGPETRGALLSLCSPRRTGGRRLDSAGGVSAGDRADWFERGSTRSGHRARAGAHPALRRLRESFPDRGRNAAVLPSGRVVAWKANPRRTRELLRRCGRRSLRQPGQLCQ